MHRQLWSNCKAAAIEADKEKAKTKEGDMVQIKIGERQSKFNPTTLRSILTNWIIATDRTFTELEDPWLQYAFEYTNPQALLALKTGNTVKADVKRNYLLHTEERKSKLQV